MADITALKNAFFRDRDYDAALSLIAASPGAFDALEYEVSLASIVALSFPHWEKVAPWDGTLKTFEELIEQTAITIGDFDYGLPSLTEDETDRLDHYNNYAEITGRIYMSLPSLGKERQDSTIWELKSRVSQMMALLPLINIHHSQRRGAMPVGALPVHEEDVSLFAYVVEWSDIVEMSSEAIAPVVPTGVITRTSVNVRFAPSG